MKTTNYHVVFYASKRGGCPLSSCRYVHNCSFFDISDREELLSEVQLRAMRLFSDDYSNWTLYARVYNYEKYFSKDLLVRRRASFIYYFSDILPNNR